MLKICQKKQIQLSRQFQQNTLAHAVIIHGIEGTGKQALAHWLLDILICQTPMLINHTGDEDAMINQACGHCKTCLLSGGNRYSAPKCKI